MINYSYNSRRCSGKDTSVSVVPSKSRSNKRHIRHSEIQGDRRSHAFHATRRFLKRQMTRQVEKERGCKKRSHNGPRVENLEFIFDPTKDSRPHRRSLPDLEIPNQIPDRRISAHGLYDLIPGYKEAAAKEQRIAKLKKSGQRPRHSKSRHRERRRHRPARPKLIRSRDLMGRHRRSLAKALKRQQPRLSRMNFNGNRRSSAGKSHRASRRLSRNSFVDLELGFGDQPVKPRPQVRRVKKEKAEQRSLLQVVIGCAAFVVFVGFVCLLVYYLRTRSATATQKRGPEVQPAAKSDTAGEDAVEESASVPDSEQTEVVGSSEPEEEELSTEKGLPVLGKCKDFMAKYWKYAVPAVSGLSLGALYLWGTSQEEETSKVNQASDWLSEKLVHFGFLGGGAYLAYRVILAKWRACMNPEEEESQEYGDEDDVDDPTEGGDDNNADKQELERMQAEIKKIEETAAAGNRGPTPEEVNKLDDLKKKVKRLETKIKDKANEKNKKKTKAKTDARPNQLRLSSVKINKDDGFYSKTAKMWAALACPPAGLLMGYNWLTGKTKAKKTSAQKKPETDQIEKSSDTPPADNGQPSRQPANSQDQIPPEAPAESGPPPIPQATGPPSREEVDLTFSAVWNGSETKSLALDMLLDMGTRTASLRNEKLAYLTTAFTKKPRSPPDEEAALRDILRSLPSSDLVRLREACSAQV